MPDGDGATYADTPDEGPIGASSRPVCPDCYHNQHWKHTCQCGCPDGIARKKERDAESVSAHGPSSDRGPVEGFY